MADHHSVRVVEQHAHELDPHALERSQVARRRLRRGQIDGEQVRVLVAVAVHEEQQRVAVARPEERIGAGPGPARLARGRDHARRGLVEPTEMQGGAAVAHRDPGQVGSLRRHPMIPARRRIREEDLPRQERRLVGRAANGGKRENKGDDEERSNNEPRGHQACNRGHDTARSHLDHPEFEVGRNIERQGLLRLQLIDFKLGMLASRWH
jgi:hypothetical protein